MIDVFGTKRIGELESEVREAYGEADDNAVLLGDLIEALRPFAAVAEVDIGSDETDSDLFQPINHHRAPRLTVGDLRRAAAALAKVKP